jgi:probable phosphoglycerate mutase
MTRVATAYNRITREHRGKTIVIVCHGGVIDGSFIYFFNMSTLTPPYHGLYTHNTAITNWREFVHDGQARWRLMCYNDTFHLRDVGVNMSINWTDVSPVSDTGTGHPSVPLPTEEQDSQ